MCGIYFENKVNKIKNFSFYVKEIKNNIHNRGPDNFLHKFFAKDNLLLCNSVLSITGKKKNNSALHHTRDKRFYISFNGEIYNYKKLALKYNLKNKTDSDTEILLKLHNLFSPLKVAKLLEGMFVYIVFDNKKKKIYIISDPTGEKRIFKYIKKDKLVIASTPKTIIDQKNLNREINYPVLNNYFKTRHLNQYTETIYKNIEIFEPGKIYTYDLNSGKMKKKYFDNPLSWISNQKYNFYKTKKYSSVKNYIHDKIIKTITKLIPAKISFGSAFSGGIDSSLIAAIIDKKINFKFFYSLHHFQKDLITKNISKFKKYLTKKIIIKKIISRQYFSSMAKCYKILQFPFITHDMPGYNEVYKFYKKRKIKVIFWGSGADELFGGYNFYKNFNYNLKLNSSPYSSMEKTLFKTYDQKKSSEIWIKAFKKYSKFCNSKEAKIQATLFTDYFFGSISTHSLSTHILSGENSVELRNPFLNKSLIKEILNLPIRYKVNSKSSNPIMVLKPLLKSLFSKYYSSNLIFPKQGFSGFPNESYNFLTKNRKQQINFILKRNKISIKNRPKSWKVINLLNFQNLSYKSLKLNNLFKYYAQDLPNLQK